MKYQIKHTKTFKKNLKKYKNDLATLDLIESIIDKLANDRILESKHKDHKLQGEYEGFRECHVKPDLLLIYKKDSINLILICIDIGSHGDLF